MYYSKSATVPPFVTMPGRHNGGINKGGSKSSKVGKDSKQTITKTKKLRSTEAGTDKVLLLRAALFDAQGTDKNVLDDFKAFQKFNRNGLDLELSFATGKTNQLRKWMHALCKKNMEEDYSKDYGWDDDDKNEELKEPAARFIVVREKPTVAWEQGTPVAFVHFRFTLQGECFNQMKGEPALFVYDIQVEEAFQRKGLGKHLMQVCELIGTKQRMKFVQLLLPNGSERAVDFLTSKLKGYGVDNSHHEFLEGDVEDEGFGIYGKCIDRALKATKQAAATAKTQVQQEIFDLCKLLDDGVKVTSNAKGTPPGKKQASDALKKTSP